MSALGQERTFLDSLDQLVGAGEQGRRDFKVERLRRFKVDYELKFRRLLDR
jgi:hypothetical protein